MELWCAVEIGRDFDLFVFCLSKQHTKFLQGKSKGMSKKMSYKNRIETVLYKKISLIELEIMFF